MHDSGLLHAQGHIPRHPTGRESRAAIGTVEGAVDAGGELHKKIKHCIGLVHLQSLLQGWLSGSVLGVTTGIGEM